MSSVGQGVGMVVGGVIGFYAGGNVALGASIGGAIGGYLDPPKGPKGRPPTASELAQQTAAYGVFLGRGYGTRGRYGNVFWIEGNTLVPREREASGGKGGQKGPATYDIYGTFAVGFGEGEIDAFSRLWFSGKLVFDGLSSSLGTVIASNENGGSITFYTGTATQLPDPRIQADLGADNTPAWRGMPYIVVKDWPMADFGNTLAGLQVKAEIIHGGYSEYDEEQATLIQPPTDARIYGLARLKADKITITTLTWLAWNYDLISVHHQQHIFGSDVCVSLSDVEIPEYPTGFTTSKTPLFLQQSDIDCAIFAYYVNTPTTRIIGHDTSGAQVIDTWDIPGAALSYTGYRGVIDRGELFLMDAGEKLYKLPVAISDGLTALTVESSAGLFTVEYFGASENYVFAVLSASSSPTSCTVYKIDRVTLATVATYTQAVSGSYAHIHVIGDNEFYTMATDGIIWRWLDGVPGDTGLRYTGGHNVDNRLLVVSPQLAYVVKHGSPPTIWACWMRLASAPVILGDIVEAECLKSALLSSGDLDTSLLTQEVRGYEITAAGSLRTGLEPLRAAWPFDAIMHGYKLKFVPRGGAVVATIDVGELGATADGKPESQITISREMDSQLPREVLVQYLDVNRDYDRNTGPGYKRLNTDAINVQTVDLGVVMTADEAAGTEEVLMNLYWLERNDVSFVLPPTRLNLEPSDVIEITTPTATHELRLTSTNVLTDGRIECQARLNRATIYSPASVGQESFSTGQVLQHPGPSNLVLLDVPTLTDAMNSPGILVGMGGYLDSWTSGTLFRSSDNGQTWANVQGFPEGMVSGLAMNAIGAGRTDIIDCSSALNIRLHAGDIYSVSQTDIFNGANWFAYGADGRWEILGIQNVTSESDGSITCTNLLRGRAGTEWTMALHQPYDEIVLLDLAVQKFVAMNTADIGLERLYRAVTDGRQLDTAEDEAQTYGAVNLRPLSPNYLNGSRDQVTNDWSLTWIRRTRIGGEWRDGIDALLSEASEAYEVEIWNSSYTTLKRTITGLSSPACTYTSAQQIADFVANQETLYLKIYQLSATAGRGFPLVTSIYRAPPDDPFGYSVVLGMHLSTNLSCVKGRVATAYGNAAVAGGYLNLDGTGDYLLLDGAGTLAPGTGPFTVELRYTPNQIATTTLLYDSRPSTVNGWYIYIEASASGGLAFFANLAYRITSATGLLANGVESHIALSRDASGNWRLFHNGAQVGSTYTDTNNYLNGAARPAIGTNGANTATSHVNGSIRELRCTAAARYTTTFTPPPAPFPNP